MSKTSKANCPVTVIPVITVSDCSGIWDPRFDKDRGRPMPYKSQEGLTRSRLKCDWGGSPNWCRLDHHVKCLRSLNSIVLQLAN